MDPQALILVNIDPQDVILNLLVNMDTQDLSLDLLVHQVLGLDVLLEPQDRLVVYVNPQAIITLSLSTLDHLTLPENLDPFTLTPVYLSRSHTCLPLSPRRSSTCTSVERERSVEILPFT